MSDLFDASTVDLGASEGSSENPVELLVGEGRKFATVEDLAKGKIESDRFIARLQDEKKALLEDLNARKRLEDIVDQLGVTKTTPPVLDQTNQTGTEGTGTTATPVDLDAKLEALLAKREQESRQRSNLESVKQTLVQAWGESFAQRLVAEGNSLGMSREELNGLAARNPKALLKLVGVEGGAARSESFTAPVASTNTTGFKPTTGNVRNKAYYDKLRKENPSQYHSSAVQQQEYKDAMALGDKFFT